MGNLTQATTVRASYRSVWRHASSETCLPLLDGVMPRLVVRLLVATARAVHTQYVGTAEALFQTRHPPVLSRWVHARDKRV